MLSLLLLFGRVCWPAGPLPSFGSCPTFQHSHPMLDPTDPSKPQNYCCQPVIQFRASVRGQCETPTPQLGRATVRPGASSVFEKRSCVSGLAAASSGCSGQETVSTCPAAVATRAPLSNTRDAIFLLLRYSCRRVATAPA